MESAAKKRTPSIPLDIHFRLPVKSKFAAGQLTIVDLSDIFIDPYFACGIFEIIVRLFVRANLGTGKVLVVDEAHKVFL